MLLGKLTVGTDDEDTAIGVWFAGDEDIGIEAGPIPVSDTSAADNDGVCVSEIGAGLSEDVDGIGATVEEACGAA